jgi:hypothetical protein
MRGETMPTRKTDNDIFVAPHQFTRQSQQLELLRVVPQPTDSKTPEQREAFERILESVRAEARDFRSVSVEIYPEFQDVPPHQIPTEQYCLICREYYRRYPERKAPVLKREAKLLPKGKYRVFSVRWSNPYTEPPNGLPRVLWEFTSEYDRPLPKQEAKIEAILARAPLGYCRSIGFRDQAEERGKRRWSEERKIKNRCRLLENRLRKQFSIPELYEEALQVALVKNPAYFGVEPLTLPLVIKEPEYERLVITGRNQEYLARGC